MFCGNTTFHLSSILLLYKKRKTRDRDKMCNCIQQQLCTQKCEMTNRMTPQTQRMCVPHASTRRNQSLFFSIWFDFDAMRSLTGITSWLTSAATYICCWALSQKLILRALSALTQLEMPYLTADLILSYDLMSGAVSQTTVSGVWQGRSIQCTKD